MSEGDTVIVEWWAPWWFPWVFSFGVYAIAKFSTAYAIAKIGRTE